jgi:ACS family sodium-dependent inorganic phosphate cotransporter-like MFS transporter 5
MSFCADKIIAKQWLSLAATRKTFNTIGHVGPALMLIGLAFIGCDPTLAITLLCISLTFSAGMYSGFAVK